jgi:predicted amidohydrolase YtcJ
MNNPPSRREFMGLVAGSATVFASWRSRAALAADSTDPDLVVFNANVYTVDPLTPRAEAFAVKAGRFTAIGSSDDIKSLTGRRTRTYDAKQMTVVPGFIDAHNHAPGAILLYEVLVGNPYDVEFVTIESIIEKLRARAREIPPGTWVEGYFFDDTKVKDNRTLTIRDLDQVSHEHPVAVRHRGGHTSYYNSKAFELAGITKDIKDSAAGTYDRDHDGDLNGRVTDRARLVFNKVGNHPAFTAAQMQERNRAAQAYISKQFVRYGLTGVHHEGGDLFALQEIRARGDLLHRVSYEAQDDMLEAMLKAGIATGFGDEWIRFGATSEHTCDGSFSELTMAMSGS